MSAIASADRVLSLGQTTIAIPERLLLAHARGEVLFIAGAGVSKPAGQPDFRGLVIQVYALVDPVVHQIIAVIPPEQTDLAGIDVSTLTHQQAAEVARFVSRDYDVVLGMLERRLDGRTHGKSKVRNAIVSELRKFNSSPAPLHRVLMRLADRGGAVSIVTTNFDLLLEKAVSRSSEKPQTYSLGGIPRPGRSDDFSGIFHIHGALDRRADRKSDLVVSDQDFGEFYLRRRIVPDFIYDAARLFNLVLVGYSANDPPMRYLLNAVAADGSRFEDLKERFTFIGSNVVNPIEIEDWKARGITPIHYDSANKHNELLAAFQKWADLSPISGKPGLVDSEIRRLVKSPRSVATQSDKDLFDHLIRRSDQSERIRLSAVAAKSGADLHWLDAIKTITAERQGERRR